MKRALVLSVLVLLPLSPPAGNGAARRSEGHPSQRHTHATSQLLGDYREAKSFLPCRSDMFTLRHPSMGFIQDRSTEARRPGTERKQRRGTLPTQGWNVDLLGLIETAGSCSDVAVSGDIAYTCFGRYLIAVDIADKTSPQRLGSAIIPNDYSIDVKVTGAHAYVANDIDGMRIVDVTDPTGPVEIGSFDPPDGFAMECEVQGTLAFVAMDYYGLRIVDITDPTSPTEVGAYQIDPWNDYTTGVRVVGTIAYVAAGWDGLRIVDVSDPSAPVELGFSDTPGWATRVAIDGSYAYVADGDGGLRVIDISDPNSPLEVASLPIPGEAWDVLVSGNYAYVADDTMVAVIDVSDPTGPVMVGQFDCEVAYGLDGQLAYLYLADAAYGLRIIDVSSPATPTEVGSLVIPESIADIALSSDHLFSADLYSIDIFDLAAPGIVAYLNLWGEHIDIEGTYAYVTTATFMGSSLIIVDISSPAAPLLAAELPSAPAIFFENLDVSGSYAYVAATKYESGIPVAGLLVVDVSNPSVPVQVGEWWSSVSDTWSTAVSVSGSHAYITAAFGGLRIVDVSDPSNPSEVGSYPALFAVDVEAVGTRAYVADLDAASVLILGVHDPTNPVLLGTATGMDWWGIRAVATAGKFLYVGDSGLGLRVVDASDPASAIEVGNYDLGGLDIAGLTCKEMYVFMSGGFDGLFILENSLWSVPVAFQQVSASLGPKGVELHWEIADGSDISGFNIYRKESGAPARLNSAPLSPETRSYIDGTTLPGRRYTYTIEALTRSGDRSIQASTSIETPALASALYPAAPNPFAEDVTIAFDVPGGRRVRLVVYSIDGRLVRVLGEGVLEAGRHEVTWDGTDSAGKRLAAGVYIVRLSSNGRSLERKVVLIR